MEEKFAQNKKQLLWYFLLSFSLIFLISFLILFFIEKEVSETKIEALKSQEQRVVKLENDFYIVDDSEIKEKKNKKNGGKRGREIEKKHCLE